MPHEGILALQGGEDVNHNSYRRSSWRMTAIHPDVIRSIRQVERLMHSASWITSVANHVRVRLMGKRQG